MDSNPHSCDLRSGRHSEPGRIYLITTVTQQRIPWFRDLRKARRVVMCLREAERRGLAETLAYVLMPDHLHWLMRLDGAQYLSHVVKGVKSASAHQAGQRLWQSGFHDHAVRREEDLVKLARYVVANPLRAGLVSRFGDYPHWDAVWL